MLSRESRLISKGSPFELVETTLNGVIYRTYRHGPKTLNDLYQRVARAPNREFLIQGGRRLTHTTILQQGFALGRLLTESYPIRSGMRVGLLVSNQPAWLMGFIAITSIGATVVALSAQTDLTETISALACTDCSWVIATTEIEPKLTDAGYRGSVIRIDEKYERGNGTAWPFALNTSSSPSGTFRTLPIDPEQLALIAFTSGSTGRSKAAMINHRSQTQGMMNMLLGAALSGGSSAPSNSPSRPGAAPISLLTAPFSHVSGYSHLLLMLFLGGKVVVLSQWDSATALDLIKRETVTSISGATPMMIRELVGSPRAADTLSSLRSIGIHGVSLVPGLLSEISTRLPHVTVSTGYGLTETNGTICAISGAQLTERPTSCGRPLPTVDVRIKPSERAENGSAGELWVRGAMLMQGYCGPSAEQSSLIAREWFPTGDFGFIDADGFVHVTDRAAHVIVCDGHTISCSAIERSLLESGLVKDVAIFGGPEFHHGKRLVVIAVAQGERAYSEQLIVNQTAAMTHRDWLAPHIIWIPQLPHTATGKIDRHRLRQDLLARRAG